MADYDVAVVGGGPGGSSAAWFLSRAGLRVAVLERKRFPRAKTCGDGLTPRSIKILDEMGLAGAMASYRRVRGLRVRGAGRTLQLDFPKLSEFCDYGLVRPRRDLDSEVAQEAMTAGADYFFEAEAVAPLIEGERVAGVRWSRNAPAAGGGVVKAGEGVLRADITVIADGASSPFGRSMGLGRRGDYPLGVAVRTYYRSDRTGDDFFESWLELRKDGDLLPGYGWIFPVGDGTVNVGVGLLTTSGQFKKVNLNHLQRAFVEMLPGDYGVNHETQTEPYKSGRLPMGGSLAAPYGPGFVVIGDAAGLVNPFNGEGIAYALETAKIAAGIIASGDDLRFYREALHDVYGAYYRVGRKFVKIIGRPRAFQLLCQVGMRSQTIMEFVFQVLANLAETTGGRASDRAFRALMRLAEQDLPSISEPRIPAPPVRVGAP